MKLAELQRSFLALITSPLTADGAMRGKTADGRSVRTIAKNMIRPSRRQSSYERLELYGTGYWSRILAQLGEDFVGLRTIVGSRPFERLSAQYLADCPPPSDLRDLGARLESWLRKHPRTTPGRRHGVALDMIRLEWAEIEASDMKELPRLSADALARLSGRSKLKLQPHLRLLQLSHPVDDMLLEIRGIRRQSSEITSNAPARRTPGSKRTRSHSGKRAALPAPQRVYLAIHRYGDSVRYKRLEREAFLVLSALQADKRLSDALAIKGANPSPERLTRWFAEWSALGWFCAG